MSKSMLRKVKVVSGKTAGVVARETLAIGKKAGKMPIIIKNKTVETVRLTGKKLKVKRLKYDIKRLKKKKVVIFTKIGEAIFELIMKKEKNIEKKKSIKSLVSEMKKCEYKIEKTEARINEVKKNGKKKNNYHEAVLNLKSKEKDVRMAAVKMLEQFGDKNTIPLLTKALKDPDLKIRQQAAESLRKIVDKVESLTIDSGEKYKGEQKESV